jgi:hypothetical protein
MPLTDQEIRLLLKIKGAEEFKALRAEAALTKVGMEEMAAGATKVGRSAGKDGAGRGILELSRGLEDLQYGIGGILNNIPGMLMAFGVGTGLTGVVSMALVAINQLIKHMPELMAAFSDAGVKKFTNDIEELKKQIEELEKKPHKLAMDSMDLEIAKNRIAKLQEVEAAYKALVEAKTSTQQKIGAGVKEAIVEHGGGDDEASGVQKLTTIIKKIKQKEGTLATGDEKNELKSNHEKIAKIEEMLKVASLPNEARTDFTAQKKALQDQARTISERIERDGEQRIRAMITGASGGKESSRAEMESLFMGYREAFKAGGVGDEFGAGLVSSSRENVKAGEGEKASIEKQKRAHKLAEDKRKNDERIAKEADDRTTAEVKGEEDLAKHLKDKQTGVDKKMAQGREHANKQQEKFTGDARKAIKDIEPEIQLTLAQRGEQRQGIPNAYQRGQFDAQTASLIRQQVFQYLREQGHTPVEAAKMAGQAQGIAKEDFQEQVDLAGRTMNNQEAFTSVLGQIISNQQAADAKANGIGASVRQLHAQARSAGNQIRSGGETALDQGGF